MNLVAPALAVLVLSLATTAGVVRLHQVVAQALARMASDGGGA